MSLLSSDLPCHEAWAESERYPAIPFDAANIELICEVDEQWPFFGNKKNQRWLWCAWEPRLKRIVAHAFGAIQSKLLSSYSAYWLRLPSNFFCTDDFNVYSSTLPKEKYLVGKR